MLIDWFTVAAQAVNFLILVWLLKRFLYKPVLAAIDAREQRIAAQLREAEEKKAEALKEQAAFRQQNQELAQKRAALLLEAADAAKAERERLMEAARRDAEDLHAKLQKSVNEEFGNLNRKVEALARGEVFSIARKALADLADANLETQMVALFVRRLRDLSPPQREEFRGPAQEAAPGGVEVRTALELAAPQRAMVSEAVQSLLGTDTRIEFQTRPDLLGGIELAVNGHKIAWTLADYLASLADSLKGLLEPPSAPAPAGIPAHAS